MRAPASESVADISTGNANAADAEGLKGELRTALEGTEHEKRSPHCDLGNAGDMTGFLLPLINVVIPIVLSTVVISPCLVPSPLGFFLTRKMAVRTCRYRMLVFALARSE